MSKYVPPAARNRPPGAPTAGPIKLSNRVVAVDYTSLKPKSQVLEEYRLKNYGKADTAWGEEDAAPDVFHGDS